eukprot:gene7993-5752_t
MATSDPIPPTNFGKMGPVADPIANGVEDSEALSSLLMLAKSNARLEPTALDAKEDDKIYSSELAPSDGNESGVSSNTHETLSANDEGVLNNDGSISDSPSAEKPVKDIDSSEDVKTDDERHSLDHVHDERSSPTLVDGIVVGDQKPGILVSSNHISTTDQSAPKKNAPIVQPRSSSAGGPRHRQAERSQALDASSAARTITIDELRKYFHLPIADVAKQLGTCTTALKKICRKLNIVKWPYRQILSLTKSIQSLEIASKSEHLDEKVRRQYQDQITLLHRVIGEVLRNPNKTIEHCNLSDLANEVAKGILPDTLDTNELDDGSGNEQDEAPNVERPPRRSSGGGEEKAASADLPTANGTQHTHHAHHNRSRAVSVTPMDEEVEDILRRAAETAAIPRVKAPSRSQAQTLHHSSVAAASSSGDVAAHSSSLKPPQMSRQASDEVTRGKRKLGEMDDAAVAEAAATEVPAEATAHGARLGISTAASNAAATATAAPGNTPMAGSGQPFPNIDIGTTIVNVHYYDDKPENWTFYGPVRLPPLQRKKFRPPATGNATRRNVPLMEPDVGSNAAVEFVPQTLVTAFKKSIAEQSAAAVLSNNLLMFNPLTGAYTGHLDPSVALSPMTLAMAQNPIAMHGNNNNIAPPATVHRASSGSAPPHMAHGHLAHYNVPLPLHRMAHGHPAAGSAQFATNLPPNGHPHHHPHHPHHHHHHMLHTSNSPPPPPGVLAATRQSSASMGDGNDLNDPNGGGYGYHGGGQSVGMHHHSMTQRLSQHHSPLAAEELSAALAPNRPQPPHASRPPSQQMASHPSQTQSHPATQQALPHYATYMTAIESANDEHQYLDPLQMDMAMSSSDQLDSGVEPHRKKARILSFSPTPSTAAEHDEEEEVVHRGQANPALSLRNVSHSGDDDDDDGDSAIWAEADFDPQRG